VTDDRRCFECGEAMQSVRLLDKAGGRSHHDMEYAAPEAKRSFFFGAYPAEGKVAAWLCSGCGRLALYAEPHPATP
jgi:hypothetical protein